jgi:predicted  nucleic acid-binding Zn-ribbon protein
MATDVDHLRAQYKKVTEESAALRKRLSESDAAASKAIKIATVVACGNLNDQLAAMRVKLAAKQATIDSQALELERLTKAVEVFELAVVAADQEIAALKLDVSSWKARCDEREPELLKAVGKIRSLSALMDKLTDRMSEEELAARSRIENR